MPTPHSSLINQALSPESFVEDLGTSYPTEKVMEALVIYSQTGSVETVHAETGIRPSAFRKWLEVPETSRVLDQLRIAIASKVGHLYALIAVKASTVALDRLDKGDIVLDGGVLKRLPVKARDAAYIASVFGDKHRQLYESMGTSTAVDSKLADIASQILAKVEAKLLAQAPKAPTVDDALDKLT